jgi:ribosomal protein L24E
MKKGLHIIRALFPELEPRACWWCGSSLKSGSWIGTYRPQFAEPPHGDPEFCWTCAHKCSMLAGQARVPYHFAAPGFSMAVAQ